MAGLDGLLLDLHGAVYIGGLCVVLGVCMAVFKWTFLIAGYDDSAEIPEAVAGRMVGGFMVLIGVVTGGYGVVLTEYSPPDWVGLPLALFVLVATGYLVYRLNTYESGGAA
ncbi:MAG: hypothetical protein ACI8TL_001155 [Natronomonas sp.]|jgi:hypothetical protein